MSFQVCGYYYSQQLRTKATYSPNEQRLNATEASTDLPAVLVGRLFNCTCKSRTNTQDSKEIFHSIFYLFPSCALANSQCIPLLPAASLWWQSTLLAAGLFIQGVLFNGWKASHVQLTIVTDWNHFNLRRNLVFKQFAALPLQLLTKKKKQLLCRCFHWST